jgi:hypothetical protein
MGECGCNNPSGIREDEDFGLNGISAAGGNSEFSVNEVPRVGRNTEFSVNGVPASGGSAEFSINELSNSGNSAEFNVSGLAASAEAVNSGVSSPDRFRGNIERIAAGIRNCRVGLCDIVKCNDCPGVRRVREGIRQMEAGIARTRKRTKRCR